MTQNDQSEDVGATPASFLTPELTMHSVRDAHSERVKVLSLALENLGRDADAGCRIRTAADQLLSSLLRPRVGERVTLNFGADEYAAFVEAVGKA